MPAPSTSVPAFSQTYDAATNCLLGHWLASVGDEPLRTHYADLLTAACAHGHCRFWLLDLRGRNWPAPTFGPWYSNVFAQAVQAALRQPVFIAYVLDPAHYALANTPGTQAVQRGCAAHSVYTFFFDGEAPAREWLTHQQAFDVPQVASNKEQ